MGIIEKFLLALLLWFVLGTVLALLVAFAVGWLVCAIVPRLRSARSASRSGAHHGRRERVRGGEGE